jgi:hypothetical protein
VWTWFLLKHHDGLLLSRSWRHVCRNYLSHANYSEYWLLRGDRNDLPDEGIPKQRTEII